MRILFNNIAKSATISATNESANYQVTNLVHPYIKKRFQVIPSESSSLITIEWTEDVTMDSVFFGLTNATSIQITLKNSVGGTIESKTVTEFGKKGNAVYFTKVDVVRTVEILLTGPLSVYLGGVGIGEYYQNLNFLTGYPETSQPRWTSRKSEDGQTNANYARPLRRYSFEFKDREKTDKDTWLELVDEYGQGPHWFDLSECDPDFLGSLYATIEGYPGVVKNGRRYDNGLTIEESR